MIRLTSRPNTNHAKNVIIFVGDGMGIQTGTMARIYKGQKKGKKGEESVLEWEKFPTTGMSKVSNRFNDETKRCFTLMLYFRPTTQITKCLIVLGLPLPFFPVSKLAWPCSA